MNNYVETGYSKDYVEGDSIDGFQNLADLEFYKSTMDEFNPSLNGGDITIDIINTTV